MSRDNVSNDGTPAGDTRVNVSAASAGFVGNFLASGAWKRIDSVLVELSMNSAPRRTLKLSDD